mgnify:CR=1 FL=1
MRRCVAFGDDEKLIAGGSRPCTLGSFLCSCKERNQRKHAPGWRECSTVLLAGIGARLNSPGAKYAPRAQTRGSLLPIPAAMLGRAIRVLKNPGDIRYALLRHQYL